MQIKTTKKCEVFNLHLIKIFNHKIQQNKIH